MTLITTKNDNKGMPEEPIFFQGWHAGSEVLWIHYTH